MTEIINKKVSKIINSKKQHSEKLIELKELKEKAKGKEHQNIDNKITAFKKKEVAKLNKSLDKPKIAQNKLNTKPIKKKTIYI
jgi:hypothetical protein